jgi:putative transcriptional regulator
MREEDFENLVESVRQAGEIRRGTREPGRVTEFAPVDVRAIRQRPDETQSKVARSRWDSGQP